MEVRSFSEIGMPINKYFNKKSVYNQPIEIASEKMTTQEKYLVNIYLFKMVEKKFKM